MRPDPCEVSRAHVVGEAVRDYAAGRFGDVCSSSWRGCSEGKAAIERRVEKAEIAVVLKKWDLEQEDDEHPALTLAREKRRLQARLGYLDSIVNSPGYDEEYEDKLGVLRRTPLSEAYSDEQKQLTALARDMPRLGLDAEALQLERARPSREQSEVIVRAHNVMMSDPVMVELGLTTEQRQYLLGVLAGEMARG